MKYEKWDIATHAPSAEETLVAAGLPRLAAVVLSARGIETEEEAAAFFEDGPQLLSDPMAMKDMDAAVKRIQTALAQKEKIAVYGDYDVDGVTATCLLVRCLRSLGADCTFYIPDRLEEGYGLNQDAIEALYHQGVSLMVTVDCGITAVNEVQYAKKLGMDVVITDHHECKDILPRAVAVVDPHRRDCTYPFPHLAGVGVALKLALALLPESERKNAFLNYAPLTAVGTVADVMSLTGENRFILRTGLQILTTCFHPQKGNMPQEAGLKQLMIETGFEKRGVTSTGIGFMLAPRLNAAGRMGKANLAVELLLTEDEQKAEALAEELCALNRERQAIELSIYEQAVSRIEAMPESLKAALVLENDAWHQGVVGIVASRLAEKYSCPVLMICLDGDKGKGSCRSYGGFNLFEALEQNADLLESFGGHALAAGFTIAKENIEALRIRMNAYVRAYWGDTSPVSTLKVDAILQHPDMLTTEQVEALSILEPHGAGNPKPLFCMMGLQITSLSHVGDGRHLKLRLSKEGRQMNAIFFSATAGEMKVRLGGQIDIAFSPQINEFRGQRNVQLVLSDLRPSIFNEEIQRTLYHKYKSGAPLTREEAWLMTPTRADFVGVWRSIKQQARGIEYCDTLINLSKNVARICGQQEALARIMICLDVLEECRLIRLQKREPQLTIQINECKGKVDLEQSHIMIALRQWQVGPSN